MGMLKNPLGLLKNSFTTKLLLRLDGAMIARRSEARTDRLRESAAFDQTVSVAVGAEFINHQRDPAAMTIGSHSVIRGQMMVLRHGGKIVIGKYVFLGEHSRIWSGQLVTVGDHVLISHNVNIHDTDSHPARWNERRPQAKFILDTMTLPNAACGVMEQPITIEDDVWVGFNSIILKGVRIGRGAIIAAGSVVTRDVEPFTLVAGNPIETKKQLDQHERLECCMDFPQNWL